MAPVEAVAKAPKRAPCAYWIWLSENREEVVKTLGGTKKGSEVSKKAGEMWKAMSDAEQAPYQQKAKEAKEDFEANRPQKEPKMKDEDGSIRKKPMTPVFAFIHERRAEIAAMPGVKGLGEISKKGTELYKALPEAERAEWQKRYEEEMKSYREWQETDEGQAAMAGKKSATAEKRAAKKEKVAKKEAKLARKEGRTAKAAEDAEEQPMVADEAGAEDKAKGKAKAKAKGKAKAKAKASAKRGRSGSAGAAEEKPVAKTGRGRTPSAGRGRGRGAKVVSAQAAEPEIDAKVLKEAIALSFESSLKNLASRKDVAESGKSSKELLEALKGSNGLVNPAKRALLGA